jgi:ketosteroid isomerase-like protein
MSNPDVVNRYFETMNAERWEEFAAVWTDDAVVVPVGTRPRRGPGEIVAFYSGLFKAWSTHWDQPVRFLTSADGWIAATVTFTGRSQRGRDISFDAVDVFEFREGRICALQNYYDLLLVRSLLAEEPAAG